VRRRWIFAALAAVAVVAIGIWAIAASGGDDESSDQADTSTGEAKKLGGSVRLWIMNNGPDPVGDTRRIVKPFEDRTGVDVKVQLVGWDVQFDRIRNAAVSGRGPDVTQAGTTQVPFFAALGGFENLSGRADEIGGEGAYAPAVWKTTQVQGRDGTFAVPWFTEARALYYRKDALKEAGVDPATAFTDWDAFKATLARLKRVDEIDGDRIYPYGGPGKKAFDLVHNFAPFMWAAGGSELSADAKNSTLASPKSLEGVKFYADLVNEGLFDKQALERDAQQVEDTFKGGRFAVYTGGPWVLGSVNRKEDDAWKNSIRDQIGIAPLPKGPSGKAFTFVGGSNLMMFKSSKNKDAAWELMKFLSQDRTQRAYADLMGMFPARLEPQKAVGAKDENYKAFFDAIQQGRTYAPIPQWGQVETAFKTRLGNVLDMAAGHGEEGYSQAAIEKELKAADEEANGLLSQSAG
jgi:multiple sugar transport system substrate-binding protein